MKIGKATLALSLVAGLAGGFLLALVVPLPQTWSQFSRQYAFDVIEQVSLASELRGGRHDDVRKRIEAQLPATVLAMHRDPSLRSSSLGDPLVAIKSYYFKHQIPIPEEIREILASVPAEDLNPPEKDRLSGIQFIER